MYLDWCQEDGDEPERPSSVNRLKLFLELPLYRRISLAALRNQTNIEDWIMDAVERELAASEQEAAVS